MHRVQHTDTGAHRIGNAAREGAQHPWNQGGGVQDRGRTYMFVTEGFPEEVQVVVIKTLDRLFFLGVIASST